MHASLRSLLCLVALARALLHGAAAPPGAIVVAPDNTIAPLTSIAAAFAQWPELTSDDRRAEFEGVVTGAMPSGSFRLHDGELGIYVTKAPHVPRVRAGERVRVSGVLRQGGFSPWITPLAITRLGHAPFPAAQRVPFSVLASGEADNQWVEIEGVVRAVTVPAPRDFAVLDLGMEGGSLRVLLNYQPEVDYPALIDAAVRLRGVAAVNVNAQQHVVEPSFRVPSFSEVTLLRPGRVDPFSQPLLPANRILRVSPGVQERHHRVRLGGVVTRRFSETMLYLRDGDVGMKVETSAPVAYRPGQRIEVAGFPVIKSGAAVLEHASSRLVGTAPLTPTPAALLEGRHNSDLVRLRARLVDWARAGESLTLIFQVEDQLFRGMLTLSDDDEPILPEKNSLVEVTGICVVNELEDTWVYRPRTFGLLVASVEDLVLVTAPPWWTAERLWRALALACAIILAAVGWGWALRRRVGRSRALIEQQARHAAVLEERSRIARDLHDTLEQGLTGLSLQMKALEADFHRGPDAARERLLAARQSLRESRALARNAIRELRTESEAPSSRESLAAGLKRLAESWAHSGALRVEVHTPEPEILLSAREETQLLGIATEAVTNAVKHGRARTASIRLSQSSSQLTLEITDDGSGFNPEILLQHPSGGFGLLGMRERARELAGELRLTSHPGAGTRVVARLPLPRRHERAVRDPRARAGWLAVLRKLRLAQ